MKKKILLSSISVIVFITVLSGCYSAHNYWPQKDILPRQLNQSSSNQRILIASRNSRFKNAVVRKIEDALENSEVYINRIGIEQLNNEKTDNYDVILLINTCLSWGMDPNVTSFLKKEKKQKNVIILTTSATGRWLPKHEDIPKHEDMRVDAISSASAMKNADDISYEITKKINEIINTHNRGTR